MNILIPTYEESSVFFDRAKIATAAKPLASVRSLAGLEDLKVSDSGLLVGKNVPTAVGFTDNLDEDRKQAAADSIHFAERYADGNADKLKNPIDWHNKYGEAMKHCGWSLSNYKYEDHVTKEVNVTMDAIILDIIKAVAGRNAPAMLEVLGATFDKLSSDPKLGVSFDSNSKSAEGRDFRLVPCLQSPGGTAIAAFLALDTSLKTQQGGALFWKWKTSNLRMKKVGSIIELNLSMHERRRGRILELLDADSDDFFDKADLNLNKK